MTEHKFIAKIHSLLDKEVFRWKINDPYHGGVPDTFYSGPGGFCFIEYKYINKRPARCTTNLKFNLSQQQRAWLTKQYNFGLPIYAVLGVADKIITTQDFTKKYFTQKEFDLEAVLMKDFVHKLANICLNKD
jgi:hypothetical protein